MITAWDCQSKAAACHQGCISNPCRFKLLSDLDCRIQEMNEDIAALRNALVPSRQAKKQRQSQSLFQSNYTWYIGGTALAAVSYACLVYYRNNRSSGGSQLI